MNFVEPGYKVPSRTHITTTCRRIYTTVSEELRATLSSPNLHVALTTDLWTSKATEAYLTVTCHYITDEWDIANKVLLTREMPERHTGLHIAERLRQAVSEWQIPEDRVSAIVRDNASNMNVAVEEVGWEDVRCFGHTLQLAISNGLTANPLSRLAAAARKLVGHFKHSVVATTALKQKQQQMNVPEHRLIQDVSTRWNSTYLMYERLLEQRWAIYAVMHDEQVTSSDQRYLYLKEDHWNLLQQMVTALKPLQVATTALCEAKKVSISLIYPVISGLIKKHLVVDDQDLPSVKLFKRTVVQEVKERFSPNSLSTATKAPVLAAALDPCYHQLKFLSDDQRSRTHMVLKEKVQKIYQDREKPQEQQNETNDPQAMETSKATALTFLLEEDSQEASVGEVDKYLAETPLSHDDNCLEWWKRNSSRFPAVAELAKQYLCIPATSVPSERIFSTAGLTITQQRSSLKPENADMLIFLNKNLVTD